MKNSLDKSKGETLTPADLGLQWKADKPYQWQRTAESPVPATLLTSLTLAEQGCAAPRVPGGSSLPTPPLLCATTKVNPIKGKADRLNGRRALAFPQEGEMPEQCLSQLDKEGGTH